MKYIFLLINILITVNVFGGECDSLLNEKVKGTDLEAYSYKLLECGLDSVDLPLVGIVVIQKLQNKEEYDTLTYRGVVHIINNMKQEFYRKETD